MRSGFLSRGFTLIELMIALGIASFLITAVTQLVVATGTSYRLQQNLGALQENARFALNTMQREIEAAGYRQQPWDSSNDRAIDSVASVSKFADSISVRRWSNRNCFDNPNPDLDTSGRPKFYLRETTFTLSSSKNLAQNCRYGPDPSLLTTQINNLGLVENAEALQALYAEDSDSDGNADRWVTAGQWQDESNVKAVRLAILLSTPDSVSSIDKSSIQVLDTSITPPGDGRIRRVFESTFTIKGRLN